MFIGVLCTAAKRGISKNLLAVPIPSSSSKKVITSRCVLSFMRLSSTKLSPPTKVVTKGILKSLGPKDGFVTIYRLPVIGSLSMINKAKRKQFIFQSLITPIIMALSYTGVTPMDIGLIVWITGFTLCIKLYLLGLLTTNLVGVVYVSPDMSTVQIGYLDSWGQRKEEVFPSDDLILPSDLPSSFFDRFYLQLRRYSEPSAKPFKLNVSHGNVTDMDRFTNIFGKVD